MKQGSCGWGQACDLPWLLMHSLPNLLELKKNVGMRLVPEKPGQVGGHNPIGAALRTCPMGAIKLGPWPGMSSALFRMQCKRREITGHHLPMVEAWILYIFRAFCPFWERFYGYSSHGRESKASRGLLLHGLEKDEAVTAQGDIMVGASSSRVIYQLYWSPFLTPKILGPFLSISTSKMLKFSKKSLKKLKN